MVTGMEQNMEYRQQLIQEYKQAVLPLLKYLPWLEKHAGKAGSSIYDAKGVSEHSISFPVYDSVLMSFVKESVCYLSCHCASTPRASLTSSAEQ